MIPPRTILAAVDFSESAKVALDYAARLARDCGASLHVVHGEDPMLVSTANARGVNLTSKTREELCRFVGAVATDLRVTYHVVTGAAVPCICNVAQREQLDAIVMGMRGISGADRSNLGSTTEGVLRQATASVFVVPDDWVPSEPNARTLRGILPVVAAVDCCEPAIASAAAASRIAATLGTSVEFVHIVPDLPVLDRCPDHAEAVGTQRIMDARRALEGILPAVCKDVPFHLSVKSGTVAEGIARAVAPSATRHPLLVLGRRNHLSTLGPPGATAYRVLILARVPVLLYVPEH